MARRGMRKPKEKSKVKKDKISNHPNKRVEVAAFVALCGRDRNWDTWET